MQQRNPAPQKVSIFRRVALPFVLVAVLDCMLLLFLLWVSGMFASIRNNSLSILGETTQNRYQILQREMISWSSLDELESGVSSTIDQMLKNRRRSAADMVTDAELNNALADACKEQLIDVLRVENHCGAFLVLNGAGVRDKPGTHAGIFLYDASPNAYISDNSDLSLLRGLPPLSRTLGITLHSYWEPCFTFEGGEENPANDYYYKPINAYRNRKNASSATKYYAYWSQPFQFNPQDGKKIITYTRPLVGAKGDIYGVLGVMLDVETLQSVINANAEKGGDSPTSYYLGVSQNGGASYECVTFTGKSFIRNFIEKDALEPLKAYQLNDTRFIVTEGGRTGKEFQGAVFPLNLYASNTPFEKTQWALIGLQDSGSVFYMDSQFRFTIILVTVLGLLIGMLIAVWSAMSISRPISQVVKELRTPNDDGTSPMKETGIREVDELAQTITKLNQEAVDEASRFSKIITLSGLPIGTFEKRLDMNTVFCSDGFFRLLCAEDMKGGRNILSSEAFDGLLLDRLGHVPVEETDIFLMQGVEPPRYLRLRMLQEPTSTIGTVMDVTGDVEKRRQIEHERDYDSLTNLLNRRAFEIRINALFNNHHSLLMPTSALIMLDLDNLKAINDSYGHDTGDVYIHTFAECLKAMETQRCLIGRRSGDEFYLFYYGYQSQEEIRSLLHQGWNALHQNSLRLADGTDAKIRASGGVAWFPDNSTDFSQLLRYADFAMYRVKNSQKGSLMEFSQEDYDQTGYLVNGIQALNKMLDLTLVRYAFQPIVSARDGSVLGYELLMRPMVPELSNPTIVLNLAREQGMLKLVESMTWHAALAAAAKMQAQGALGPNHLLFINTITSQILSDEEESQLGRQYRDLLSRVVVEITENESPNDAMMSHKLEMIRKNGGKIALDDFGSGYNSDLSLISIETDYVKLDKSFIRDVQSDSNKQALIASVTKYAHTRNISVIAECVETEQELFALTMLQVDYFQGFFVGFPDLLPTQPSPTVVAAIQAADQAAKRRS